jgi:tape measure domain-containing protein
VIDRKEVELLIRAQLKGGRDIDSITKSIDDLQKAIEKQAAAAKKGESAYEGLKVAAEALKTVQEELGARGKALQDFDKITKVIQRQETAVEKARKKLSEYEAALGSDRTAKQQDRVQSLTAAYQRATRDLANYKQSFETLGAALREAGVDTENLTAAQKSVAERQLSAASAQRKVSDELLTYNDTIAKAREETRKKAEADRTAARDADLFAAAEKRAADASKARAQRFSEFDSRQAGRRGDAAATDRSASEQQAAQERARQLAALRADIEARSAQGAKDSGLRKTADDAEAAAKSFSTLARASTDLRPRVASLRDAVNDLVNPGEAARKTLAGVEAQIADVASKLKAGAPAIKDYSEQFNKLSAAQKAIGAQAGLIDNFRNQVALLRQNENELSKAQAQVRQYADAVRQGGEAGTAFVDHLAKAQIRVRQAATAFRDQAANEREARNALQLAGIDTRNLADAQTRLITATKNSTDAMKQLADAAKRGSSSFSLFRDEGRTTLSFVQRLRGELLALTTAYFGVQGGIQLATDALKAFGQQQGLQAGLKFALGDDPTKIADEMDYIRSQSDRLGLSLEGTSKEYLKFLSSAVKSGAGLQESRFIFESFAEVGKALNLTPDALNGIFNAISQSFSKGKIQAEELRQQIGERLPGAFTLAQEALKSKFPDLNKALEKGEVGAENLLIIAESIRKQAQSSLGPALNNLDSAQQRFNNSVYDFKRQIAESGFADAYIALLKELTEFFKSTEGKRFAETIAEIGKAFLSTISSLVEYRKELGLLALLFATSLTAGALARTAGAVTAFGVAAAAAVPGIASLAAAVTGVGTALLRAVPVVAAALAGFSIGTYFYEQSETVRVAGVLLVTGIAKLWSQIKFGAIELWESLPVYAENALKAMINAVNRGMNKFLQIFAAGARALGMTDFAKTIEAAIVTLDLKYESVGDKVKDIRAQAEADIKGIRKIADEMLVDALRRDPIRLVSPNKRATLSPGPRTTGSKSSTDADIAKRERMIEAIDNALNALDAKIERAQTETLSKQLEAVDNESKRLFKKIAEVAKFDPTKALAFSRRAQELIEEQKLVITKKFNDKILDEQNALQTKIEEVEATAGRKQKLDLEARQSAIVKSYENEYRQIADLRQKLERNGRNTAPADEAKRRLDLAVQELKAAEAKKFITDQLAASEAGVNDLLKARAENIKTTQDLQAAGLINQQAADAKIIETIDQFQPKIDALILQAREFAATFQGAIDPAALDQFLAKLALAQGSGARMNAEFDRTGNIIKAGIGDGVNKALDTLYESIGKVVQGTNDWGDAFDAVSKSILQSLAEILREIAKAVLRQQILIALRAIGVPVAHSGGVVGQSINRSRNVNPTMFANAPRYHLGGVVGLAPNEYPAILEKNEEVLTTSDPRNVMNGGLGGIGKTSPTSQKFVLVDDRARVAEAMMSDEGEQVTLLHLRKNVPTLRTLLK